MMIPNTVRALFCSIVFALSLPVAALDGARVEDLGWLTGHWSAEGEDGRYSEEIWSSPRGGMLLGMNRDIRGSHAMFEFLRIAETGDGIVYFAQPRGREATSFRLAELAPNRAVFANPAHDFPQRITYTRDGDRLCARIEGEGGKRSEWCWTRQ